MSERLPERIEPLSLAETGRTLCGIVSVAAMRRLAPLLAVPEGELAVDLRFGIDADRIHTLTGTVRGRLQLVCQRCLGPMELPVDLEISLGMVRDAAEGERLPPRYEALMVAAEPMTLAEIVEDELLLAMPIVALHQDAARCSVPERYRRTAAAERKNPFAVLAQWKRGD